MPSLNKTPELALNQWGPSDKPKWPDLNADNAIVSAAVGNLSLLGTTDKTSLVAAANEIKNIRAALAPPRGRYDTYELLAAAHPAGEAGQAYLVGVGSQPELYVWDVDQADWIPAGNLQGVPGPNEITTATATPLSGVLVGKNGYVKEGAAGMDFAAAVHAAQHAANGTDPFKIGNVPNLFLATGQDGVPVGKNIGDTKTLLGVGEPLLTGVSIGPGTQFTVAGQAAYTLFTVNTSFTQVLAWRVGMVVNGFGLIGHDTTSYLCRLVISTSGDVWTFQKVYMIPLNSGGSIGTIEVNGASRLILSVTGII